MSGDFLRLSQVVAANIQKINQNGKLIHGFYCCKNPSFYLSSTLLATGIRLVRKYVIPHEKM
jgi:hypothetical protein